MSDAADRFIRFIRRIGVPGFTLWAVMFVVLLFARAYGHTWEWILSTAGWTVVITWMLGGDRERQFASTPDRRAEAMSTGEYAASFRELPPGRSDELEELLGAARGRPPMTPAEREDQARNFAAGNVGISDPRVTREVVDEAMRRRGQVEDSGEAARLAELLKGASVLQGAPSFHMRHLPPGMGKSGFLRACLLEHGHLYVNAAPLGTPGPPVHHEWEPSTFHGKPLDGFAMCAKCGLHVNRAKHPTLPHAPVECEGSGLPACDGRRSAT